MFAERVVSYLATFGTPCPSQLQGSTENLWHLWNFLIGSYVYLILDATRMCLYKGQNVFLQNREECLKNLGL